MRWNKQQKLTKNQSNYKKKIQSGTSSQQKLQKWLNQHVFVFKCLCAYALWMLYRHTRLTLGGEQPFLSRQQGQANEILWLRKLVFFSFRKCIVEKDRKYNRSDCLCQFIIVFHCVTSLRHQSPWIGDTIKSIPKKLTYILWKMFILIAVT